ncbi:MAG: cupin domain-containing protein [Pyrinomonadaceae bacterium]|nr:cupin domain-containing protein [Pyrinomonadaceae bacterium]
MSLPLILQPGEGRSVQLGTRTTCTFKVTGKDTHSHFGLFEFNMDPGAEGASAHYHKKLVEMFYVAEGEVELLLEQRKVIAPPGTFMLVPENTSHGFSNPSRKQAKLLIMFCPADSREKYFEGLAELTTGGRSPSQKELLELMLRFDQYMVTDQTTP